jgi:hypothetical protein
MSDQFAIAERIADLISRHITNELKPGEGQELEAWASESEENRKKFNELTDVNRVERDWNRRRLV